MSCFDYPIDTKMLYRKKNAIRRELSAQENLLPKKIAILGGSTTSEVADQLELFLLHYGIKPEFYQSEYGRYWQDAVFDNPKLDAFSPDVIYIHTNWRNVEAFPELSEGEAEAEQKLAAEAYRFKSMWESLEKKYGCPVIQNNFDRPNYRLLGNRDIWDYRGRSRFLFELNRALYEYAAAHANFYVNDIDYLAQDYGLSEWNDAKYWHMYKCAMCMDAMPLVADSVAKIIKSIFGKNKKALVLDLDNTLWGGVVGDDGVEGIQIGPEVPAGQVYAEFQSYCKDLKNIGVVLGVDSKNDYENAIAGLGHPDGKLRPEDFVSVKANWEPKDGNLTAMANELDLGVDSFVFVDDNPAERELVRRQLPGVAVPEWESVENVISVLDHQGYFEVTALSAEDGNKTGLYRARAKAKAAENAFADYASYLKHLEMQLLVESFLPMNVQRVAQLTNKSNQFNLTTLRCTEEDIRRMEEDPNCLCFCGRLKDRFADHGIVTVVAGHIAGDALEIDLWLMSCRVLKRGVEDAMMQLIFSEAEVRGLTRVVGKYIPTPKNGMVKDFYKGYGFAPEEDNPFAWTVLLLHTCSPWAGEVLR